MCKMKQHDTHWPRYYWLPIYPSIWLPIYHLTSTGAKSFFFTLIFELVYKSCRCKSWFIKVLFQKKKSVLRVKIKYPEIQKSLNLSAVQLVSGKKSKVDHRHLQKVQGNDIKHIWKKWKTYEHQKLSHNIEANHY